MISGGKIASVVSGFDFIAEDDLFPAITTMSYLKEALAHED